MQREKKENLIKSNNVKRRIENIGSRLLTKKENEELLNLLDTDQYAICSGVAHVLKTNKHFSPGWEMIGRGVIVYIKDYHKKLYILKLYCLPTKRCIWEHILYTDFMPVFGFERIDTLEYTCDGEIFCIHFSHHAEAQLFYTLFKKKFEKDGNCELIKDNLSQLLSGQLNKPIINSLSQCNLEKVYSNKDISKIIINEKKSKKKFKKSDISSPTNFSHLVHIGWSKNEEISNNINNNNYIEKDISQSVKDLLKAAGYDYKRMKEKDLQFAKIFVEDYEKKEKLNKVGLINDEDAISTRPLISNDKFENINFEMVSPISIKHQQNIVEKLPPTPPPLPLSMIKNEVNSNTKNINKLNKSLKNENNCNDLMSQIKQGKTLNHVDREVKSRYLKNENHVVEFNNSLTAALRNIMNERRQKLSEEDNSSSTSSSTGDWD
ncbi:WASp [Strongyloides ratti]|uniref:WASp n=1 Tax=Strongyloides ratti TaxID=34506 RepID=A0A090L894_STRRB|nr:WASp [Strongyloides ratti]CEF66016.1 WASp [Strongyloides ratti]